MALRLSPECDGGIARDEVKVIATHDTCRVALEGQGWSVACSVSPGQHVADGAISLFSQVPFRYMISTLKALTEFEGTIAISPGEPDRADRSPLLHHSPEGSATMTSL